MSSSRSLLLLAVLLIGGLLSYFLFMQDPGLSSQGSETVAEETIEDQQIPAEEQPGVVAEEAVEASGKREALLDPDEAFRAHLSGFRGRLVDRSGKPLPGTPLRLFRIDPEILQVRDIFKMPEKVEDEPLQLQIHASTTDAQGEFEILGTWPQAMHLLEADPDGTRRTTQFIDRSPGPGEIVDLGDIVLDDLGVITGRVVDENDQPVPGAMVRAIDLPIELLQTAPFERLEPEGAIFGRFDAEPMVMLLPPFVKRYFDMVMRPRTTTRADGSFRLAGVQPGMNTLVCNKRGLSPKLKGHLLVKPRREKNARTIVMEVGGTARIEVFDSSEKPIVGAEVLVAGTSRGIPIDFGWRAGKTDAEGRLTVPGVPSDDVVVAVRGSKEQPWVAAGPQSVDKPVRVVLPARRHLDVTLESLAGQKIVDPEFRLMHSQQNGVPLDAAIMGFVPWMDVTGRVVRTEEGAYRIPDLIAGKYSLAVRARGHAAARSELEIRESTSLKMKLPAQQTFQVRVINSLEKPVVGAKVYLQLPRGARGRRLVEFPLMVGRTNDKGMLRIDQSSAGEIRLSASHPAYGKSHAVTKLPVGEPVVLQMADPGELHGLVTEKGGPATPGKWTVLIEPRRARDRNEVRGAMPNLPRFTTPDLEGRFHVRGIRPGRYRLQVVPTLSVLRSPGGMANFVIKMESRSRGARALIEVESGRATAVEIEAIPAPEATDGPTVKLSGQVMINGQPREGLLVLIRGKRRDAVNTDASGRFDFGQVPVAKVPLRVMDPNQVMIAQGPNSHIYAATVELKDGADSYQDIQITTGGIIGQVFRADGAPAASLRLMAAGASKKGGASRSYALSDPQGRFAFTDISPGSYRVEAMGRDQGVGSVDTTVAPGVVTRGLRVQLQATYSVRGRVEYEGRNKEQAIFGWLEVVDAKGNTRSWASLRGQGEFRVRGLANGTYTIKARIGERRSGGRRIRKRYKSTAPLVVDGKNQKDLVVQMVPAKS